MPDSRVSNAKNPAAVALRLVPAIAVVAACVIIVGIVGQLAGFFSFSNPFDNERKDRSGPPVLISLTAIEEFHAATGYYETIVDIEDDTAHLPDWVSGERVLYVGKGTADGVVDFSALDDEHVIVSADRQSATIYLPEPTINKPNLDIEKSYVVEHSEGIGNKFSGSDLEDDAQKRALKQLTDAATGTDDLRELAKSNTEKMLRGLLGSLGFTEIVIKFGEEPPEPTESAEPSESPR